MLTKLWFLCGVERDWCLELLFGLEPRPRWLSLMPLVITQAAYCDHVHGKVLTCVHTVTFSILDCLCPSIQSRLLRIVLSL